LKLREHLTLLTIASLTLATDGVAASIQTFSETHELLPNEGSIYSEFGFSCDFSGTTGVIGAPNDPVNGYSSGAAYLFDLSTGQELTKLSAADGEAADNFGWAVAIHGDLAVIGAPFNQDLGLFTGAIYLFDVDTGAELAKLLPNDVQGGFRFGYSVAMTEELIFAGALYDLGPAHNAGSVYVIDRVTHQVLSKLLASDSAVGNKFGSSLDVSGETVIVGAIGNNDGRGCAYLFDISDPLNPRELAKLTATDGAPVDYFGTDVAIDGDRAIVSSPNADIDGVQNIGAAYIFDVNSGAELHKLTPPWIETNTFAASVSISGDTAIVGDPHANIDLDGAGAAYAYRVEWGTLKARLEPSHSTSDWGDMAGASVEIQGNTVLVGAPWHDHDGASYGAAHLFHIAPGHPFCFGDSFSSPHCPCGNSGDMGEGCSNSTGAGASLRAVGSTNMSFDNLVLETSGLPEGAGIFFQGNDPVWFGPPQTMVGAPFGDGMRCVGGGVVRLEVRYSDGGVSRTTTSIASRGEVSPGEIKYYQCFYRDVNGSPCGSLFNLSNGYQIKWTP